MRGEIELEIKTTDLCDQYYPKVNVAEPMFTSFGKKKAFHGKIATVKVFDDNVLVRKLIETLPPGSVLVVEGRGSKNCALLGDNVAGIAAQRGLAGIIINGYVRDTADLLDIDLGILALGSYPVRSGKEGKGEENVKLTFGSVEWKPGDYVYADEDGVVLSSEELEIQ
jgi:regulator of ribonuclease activity A